MTFLKAAVDRDRGENYGTIQKNDRSNRAVESKNDDCDGNRYDRHPENVIISSGWY